MTSSCKRCYGIVRSIGPIDVIARLDRAIQYSRPVVTGSPVKPGDDSELRVDAI
jgi:hypothetical protein